MYGMVNRALEDMIVSAKGPEAWEQVVEKAKVDVDVFISTEGYPDAMTYSLVGAASETLGEPVPVLLERFGVHWIVKTAQHGYEDLLFSGGRTLRDFLINLPDFHSRVSLVFPHLEPPRFACSDVEERSLRLHYFSHRPALAPFVIGLVKGLGQLFDTPLTVHQSADRNSGADHDEFDVAW